VASTGRKSTAGPVFAFSLQWRADEVPDLDRAEMLRAADSALKVMKLDHLQAVIVAHTDRAHPHVHVILNRVNPENGKLEKIDPAKARALNAWAHDYEKQNGKLVSPNRSERMESIEKARERYPDIEERREHIAKKKAAAETVKTPASGQMAGANQKSRPPSEGQILRDLQDGMKAQHKREWGNLSRANVDARQVIYADFSARLKEVTTHHRNLNRPMWSQHFRTAHAELWRFSANERQIAGVISNALNAAKHQLASGQAAPGRGLLSLTWANVLDGDKRRAAFNEAQEARAVAVTAQLRRGLHVDISALKQERANALAAQRQAYDARREGLISQQNHERGKMREAWQQLYVRRGKDPQYLARQNARPQQEQKPVKRDFDKARTLEPAKIPQHPTERRFVSTPTPTPSPVGAVPQPSRVAQEVPKKPDPVPVQKKAPPPPMREAMAQASKAPPPPKEAVPLQRLQPAAEKPSLAKEWGKRAPDKTGLDRLPPLDPYKPRDR